MEYRAWSLAPLGPFALAGLVLGLAPPAHAVPLLFTFSGTVTSQLECFDADCLELGGGAVTYTFLVDFGRLGEVIDKTPDGETIMPLEGTFYARYLGYRSEDGTFETRENHVGQGMTLADFKDSQYYPGFTEDNTTVSGLPGSTWSVGAHFEGEDFLLRSCGHEGCPLIRVTTLSELTIREIHGVPEPNGVLLLLAGLGLLTMRQL